jgi:SagB-type dehydrogenase family enzyme
MATGKRRVQAPTLSARLGARITLEAREDGNVTACCDGHSVGLGTFSTHAVERAWGLRTGLPFASLASEQTAVEKEVSLLARRLAMRGLLEYRIARAQNGKDTGADNVVIEPQVPDYWPRNPPRLGNADVLVLSRFSYLRRRGDALVLESPRAGALFKLCNPAIVSVLAMLSAPQPVKRLREQEGFPGLELLGLLVDCGIVFKIDPARSSGLRPDEGDNHLVLWDFHDLLFHARSTQGRHANPMGGVYPYAGLIPAPPAVRPRWPGRKIDLRKVSAAHAQPHSVVSKVLRERHSTRSFDDRQPITLAELACFLDASARVQSKFTSRVDLGDGEGPAVAYATRPYPSGGGSWELELYLAVDKCDGLARGFYHYDAGAHALVPIVVRAPELEAVLREAEFAMGAPDAPQVLIIIGARFGRTAWKYSSLAYALILKDVGVLMQTLYLMATDMNLGGCAIGSVNIDRFAKMTGIEFHIEGPVGQFALGRLAKATVPT